MQRRTQQHPQITKLWVNAPKHATAVLPGGETAASTRAEMVSTLFASIAVSENGLFSSRERLVSLSGAGRR